MYSSLYIFKKLPRRYENLAFFSSAFNLKSSEKRYSGILRKYGKTYIPTKYALWKKGEFIGFDYKKYNKKNNNYLSTTNIAFVNWIMIYQNGREFKCTLQIFDNKQKYYEADFENIGLGEAIDTYFTLMNK